MDFYHYYLRRLEDKPDQKMAVQSCRDMAMRLFEMGPLTWAIASGAALLSALHEMKTLPGTDPLPIYEEIEQALFSELQGVRLDLEHDRNERINSTGCGRPKQMPCRRRCDKGGCNG